MGPRTFALGEQEEEELWASHPLGHRAQVQDLVMPLVSTPTSLSGVRVQPALNIDTLPGPSEPKQHS